MVASIETLSIFQLFMDSVFYGCFVLLFTVSSFVLDKRYRQLRARSRRKSNSTDSKESESTKTERSELGFWRMLGTVMIVLTTCHWAFGWAEMMADPDNVDLRSQMSFMRFLFEMLNIFVGDSLLLSRLWTIGGKRPIIIGLPLLCFVGFIACAIRLTVIEVQRLLLSTNLESDNQSWFISTTAFTTIINLYSTGYIAWKAWFANKLVSGSIGSIISHIASIVVESAAIYTIWTFVLLIMAGTNTLLWSILLPVSPSLYGCTMMLISVRLGLGWAMGLSGQAPKEAKPLVMQFVRSEISESTVDSPLSLHVHHK